ncbi:MAG: hypothetical protein PHU44_12220, partial [Syntrophales bacterium]|nr:hypothetical protein [Syntrophales bacterium]
FYPAAPCQLIRNSTNPTAKKPNSKARPSGEKHESTFWSKGQIFLNFAWIQKKGRVAKRGGDGSKPLLIYESI